MTHQRKGVSSNAQAGKDFENQIIQFFNENGFILEKQKRRGTAAILILTVIPLLTFITSLNHLYTKLFQ